MTQRLHPVSGVGLADLPCDPTRSAAPVATKTAEARRSDAKARMRGVHAYPHGRAARPTGAPAASLPTTEPG